MSDETQAAATAETAVPTPLVARIAKIRLGDYRAFPGGQTYEFDLSETGKNLLLYGENGSGKTSLFRALRDLTALYPGPVNFADLRHIFAPGEEGFLSVQLTAEILLVQFILHWNPFFAAFTKMTGHKYFTPEL